MTANPMMSMAGAQAALNALTALLNGGSIKIYSGAMPATTETASSGTLLSSGCTLAATAFGSATDPGSTGLATATAGAIASDTNAAATGTAGYFRAYKSDGTTCVIQGTVGTSAADMILNTTSISAGSTVAITSWVVTLPDGSGAD
jgi:hypothetical protein